MTTTQKTLAELNSIHREMKGSHAEYNCFVAHAIKRLAYIGNFAEKRVKPLSPKELTDVGRFSNELTALRKKWNIAWIKYLRSLDRAGERLNRVKEPNT